MTTKSISIAMRIGLAAGCLAFTANAAEPQAVIDASKRRTPSPPWAAGDERGMANQMGAGTWGRCAWHMQRPNARSFELSYVRSNTMPTSPFSAPYVQKFKPSSGIPGTAHAFNGEAYEAGAEPAQQATQIDAIGHFAFLGAPWDGKPPFPATGATYYGGYTQRDVKPTDDSPLLKLGVEKIPPIITSALVLDAKALKGGAMKAGETITAKDIEAMLRAQGLAQRGILGGDVVYIRTGWGERWRDPDTEKAYYMAGPGITYDAAQYLTSKRIVAVGLDVPFIDAAADGFIQGKAGPAPGGPAGLPFAVHHHMLTQAGIHHLENTNLTEIADAKVWTSCTMILPLRTQGSAGSAIRPVAIGAPEGK
jgi:kynurenine formamidase